MKPVPAGPVSFFLTFASNVKRMSKTTKKKPANKKPAAKKQQTRKKAPVKHKKGAGPPIGNTNAAKWTEEEATALFNKALAISADKTSVDNDFIGEVAQEAGTNLSIMEYLRNKYPALVAVYDSIKRNCESNCFRNGKTGKIIPSLAIMNLKSNHGWTDRNTVESTNVHLNTEPISKEEIQAAKAKLNDRI